ncbi:MAG: DMT family transporter [Clostridia bacterium]|nr:DMT family transporter [Clostridia bacterium]
MTNSKRLRGNILLFIAAFIWGTAFVGQRAGVDVLHGCTFNGIRSFLGCIALTPVILFMDNRSKKTGTYAKDNPRVLILGGIICGILLFVASTAQTVALADADEGKGGFMTALYLVIVPVLGIFMGKKIKPVIWLCVALATAGLYFLCVEKGTKFMFDRSELLLLLCALVFAFHILAVDYFSPRVNGVKLSFLQFFVVGLISLVYIVFIDKPSFDDILKCAIPLLYTGVMSSGVAYTLQIVAQKDTDPTVASIIMSMESLFALLAGIAFSGVFPELRAVVGCVFMMAAIILVQLPEKGDKSNA